MKLDPATLRWAARWLLKNRNWWIESDIRYGLAKELWDIAKKNELKKKKRRKP